MVLKLGPTSPENAPAAPCKEPLLTASYMRCDLDYTA